MPVAPFRADADDRFVPLSRSSLSQQAYDEIRSFLMRGRLKPGERLVSRLLAAKLGISTTPVREALLRLASEQALELDRRNTVVVPVISPDRYEEIRDLRVQLEGFAALRAAGVVAPAELDELVALHQRHAAAEDEGHLSDALEYNERFHFALCQLARLPTLIKMVEMLWLQCGPLLNHFYAGDSRVWPSQQHPHLRVIDGLRRRDGQAAQDAICCDILEGARPILSRLRALTDS